MWRSKDCSKVVNSDIKNSLVVQRLGLQPSTAEGTGSIPGQGTKIPQVTRHSQKKRCHTYQGRKVKCLQVAEKAQLLRFNRKYFNPSVYLFFVPKESVVCQLQKWHLCKTNFLKQEQPLQDFISNKNHTNQKLTIPNYSESVCGASLVAQWLRVRLPMQGTRVRALVCEDPTCRGAAGPVRHNYWAHVPQLLKPARLEPVLRNERGHRNERSVHRDEEWPPPPATRESLDAAMKTQCSQK